ncbi:MAG: PP2C family protein-serine/threonine phosphatase, partial [Acidimicrobiales bacterium]
GPSVGAEQEGGLTLKVGRSDPARRPFDRREAELVRGAAARAAVALEAARLAEQEHATALALQRALLPSSTVERADLATAARYRPGDARLQVGGDWYETVPLADGRVAVAVGDVVGRGLAAAAVMGQLRTAFAALAPGGASPGVLLDELDAFARRVEGASYSTMCCAFVDPARGELRYASAGHPPMLVVEPGAAPRYLEDGRSQPLGAGPPRARPEAEAPLPPGATLLLYSDGLVERRREPLERSLRRLAAAAASAAKLDVGPFCDEVLAALTAGRRLDDDLVLLAVAAQPDRRAACEPAAPSRAGER